MDDKSNSMASLKEMQLKFPKLNKQWTIIHFLDHTKLTRYLSSEKHHFSAIQETQISESGNEEHLLKIKLVTPSLMRIEKNLEIDDEFSLKQIDYTTSFEFDVKSKSGMLDHVRRVERENRVTHIKMFLSYSSVVTDLRQITIREDQNGNLHNSMFYNCLAEQIEHYNIPHQKRVHPNDSFTMACGLQLHSMSGNHYDHLRNK